MFDQTIIPAIKSNEHLDAFLKCDHKMGILMNFDLIDLYQIIKSLHAHGKKELTDPRRMLTTSVVINSHFQRRLPVKTTDDIPKGLLFEAMEEINKIKVKVPVNSWDVLLKNLLNTGVDIVSTMSLEK